MRTVTRKKLKDQISVANLLKETNYLSVNQMAIQQTLSEAFKVKTFETIPALVDSLLQTSKTNISCITRAQVQGKVEVQNTKHKGRADFIQNAAQLWNILSAEIKEMQNY